MTFETILTDLVMTFGAASIIAVVGSLIINYLAHSEAMQVYGIIKMVLGTSAAYDYNRPVQEAKT